MRLEIFWPLWRSLAAKRKIAFDFVPFSSNSYLYSQTTKGRQIWLEKTDMRWVWQQFSDKQKDRDDAQGDDKRLIEILRQSLAFDSLTRPTTLLSTGILTTGILIFTGLYRSRLRRIPNANYLPPSFLPAQTSSSPYIPARHSLFGRVTSVGDADNFRVFHTPGGLFAFWSPFPIPFLRRRIPSPETSEGRKQLKDQTVHVRIAGIDAPELAHFGKPAQPHSKDALQWLKAQIQGRRVRVYTYRRDQYERVVAKVLFRRCWGLGVGWPRCWHRDLGLEMVRNGWAGMYEAKSGSCFGSESEEKRLKHAEEEARQKGRGMWQGMKSSASTEGLHGIWSRIRSFFRTQPKGQGFESPRDYKTRMRKLEEQKHKN